MDFPNLLVFGLLVLAVTLGYILGSIKSSIKKNYPKSWKSLSTTLSWPQQRYYEGLTHLLNDEPDAAIDTFIAALEVNSDTLETHLALGNLLRRRGEVARAIRVHQNLLARPSLTRVQLQHAQMELGIDYMCSGLLDRAESLFKELVAVDGVDKQVRRKALERLLEIYQDTNEWLAAIETADQLAHRKISLTSDKWRELQAHFSCELSQISMAEKDWLTARRWLRSALRYDKKCARANLLTAKLEMALEAYPAAIAVLRKIPQQNEKYAAEILAPLFQCYKKLNNPLDLLKELRQLYAIKKDLLTLRYLAKTVETCEGGEEAVLLLMDELPHYPEMDVAGELLKLVRDERGPTSLRNYVRVKGLLEKLTETKQVYSCENCGFSGGQLHWLCPRCKNWGTISLNPHRSNLALDTEKRVNNT